MSAIQIFLYTGCRTERENVLIEGRVGEVCGWVKHYVLRNIDACSRAKYGCAEGEQVFLTAAAADAKSLFTAAEMNKYKAVSVNIELF